MSFVFDTCREQQKLRAKKSLPNKNNSASAKTRGSRASICGTTTKLKMSDEKTNKPLLDLQNLVKSIREIDAQGKQVDAEIYKIQREIQEKYQNLRQVEAIQNGVIGQKIKIQREISRCQIAHDEITMAIRKEMKDLNDCYESISDAKVELAKLEAYQDYWQVCKYDAIEQIRRREQNAADRVQFGVFGRKLLTLKKQIDESKHSIAQMSNLKSEKEKKIREAKRLDYIGQKLKEDSLSKGKELRKAEEELRSFKVSLRVKESHLAAKKIRLNKKKSAKAV